VASLQVVHGGLDALLLHPARVGSGDGGGTTASPRHGCPQAQRAPAAAWLRWLAWTWWPLWRCLWRCACVLLRLPAARGSEERGAGKRGEQVGAGAVLKTTRRARAAAAGQIVELPPSCPTAPDVRREAPRAGDRPFSRPVGVLQSRQQPWGACTARARA
jgi:hypothetical protein